MVQRRLSLDFDGNFRLYSREEGSERCVVSRQALPKACRVHGICGPNSVCSYFPDSGSGRRCSCIPGYEMKDPSDWSYGRQPKFNPSCDAQEAGFLLFPHLEFYGYYYGFYPN
ncbi:putative receptor protein kinase ZmPK1 [Vitis vinifera]|uniref:Putative receptor protein kinase ZmPK1 n=1 Tax=Vitis vinifera TaxID=29760 RepID=A0A438ITB5_VITVI|nr:putative receptor protein kinase ZmPK1 [Vitis vinifera]RVW99956.1 putative receptor protein kinase ZmPK1 [Vitis vinifera]